MLLLKLGREISNRPSVPSVQAERFYNCGQMIPDPRFHIVFHNCEINYDQDKFHWRFYQPPWRHHSDTSEKRHDAR